MLKNEPGRVLALDLGEKRIGLAVSDKTRTVARGLTVVQRRSRAADFEQIGRVIAEQQVNLVVVGLPLLPSGAEGTKAAWARDYAAELGERLRIDTVLWDESLSTRDAEASLKARGQRGRQLRRRLDAVAAAFILQSFLDAQRV